MITIRNSIITTLLTSTLIFTHGVQGKEKTLPQIQSFAKGVCQQFTSKKTELKIEGEIDATTNAVLFKKFLGTQLQTNGKIVYNNIEVKGLPLDSIPDKMGVMECSITMVEMLFKQNNHIRERQHQLERDKQSMLQQQKLTCDASHACEAKLNSQLCTTCSESLKQALKDQGWNATAIRQQCKQDCKRKRRKEISHKCWNREKTNALKNCNRIENKLTATHITTQSYR